MRLLPVFALAACTGSTGTIQLELTAAPGSNVIEAVQRLRVTLTDPPFVTEAVRTDNGFNILIDVEASGTAGTLIVEGFDDNDSLVATGMSYKEIASELFISHRTVQNHVQNTLGKLQLHNRIELVRFAIAKGLDTPEA